MLLRRLALSAPLALGLALSACNQGDNAPVPTAIPETQSPAESGDIPLDPKALAFEQELLAVKARETDPEKIEAANRVIMARYGYAIPQMEAQAPEADPVDGPLPLAKEAAFTTKWHRVRLMNLAYQFAHSVAVAVPPGYSLDVKAASVDGGTDPVLVGFYQTSGSLLGEKAFTIKVVGYNNDETSFTVNSRFKYKNNGVATMPIRLVSFCYPGTYGRTRLSYTLKVPGSVATVFSQTMWVSGMAQYWNHIEDNPKDFAGCVSVTASLIRLEKKVGAGAGIGTSLLAVHGSAMRGGFIRETTDNLLLEDVLPSGGDNLLLGFVEGDGKPQPPQLWGGLPKAFSLNDRYGDNLYLGSMYNGYKCF
jgi:hypothetical protein